MNTPKARSLTSKATTYGTCKLVEEFRAQGQLLKPEQPQGHDSEQLPPADTPTVPPEVKTETPEDDPTEPPQDPMPEPTPEAKPKKKSPEEKRLESTLKVHNVPAKRTSKTSTGQRK